MEKEKHKFTIVSREGEKTYYSDKPIPEIVEEQNPDLYANATGGELENLHFRMSRLAEEGHDFLEDMQTIENELIGRSEEPNRYKSYAREELKNSLTRAEIQEEQGLSMTRTIIKIEEALEKKVDSGIVYEAE